MNDDLDAASNFLRARIQIHQDRPPHHPSEYRSVQLRLDGSNPMNSDIIMKAVNPATLIR